jgi:para-aminobenzoate synthetase/4-amino-4-deoxychorismate lyase
MFRRLPENFRTAIDDEANSVLLQTARFDSANSNSYLFRNCRETLLATSLDEVPAVFARVESALEQGFYVVGFLSYECGAHFEPRALPASSPAMSSDEIPLVWFGVFEAPTIFDHRVSSLQPRVSESRTWHSTSAGEASPKSLDLDIALADYSHRIEWIKRYIEAGDTYQVNFTTGVGFSYTGTASELFSSLLENQPIAYGALLNLGGTHIVSASPELFFRLENGKITTQPMKGTAPRGKDVDEDAIQANWLANDEKNRSENVMIVDLLRNDLGRVCKPGSVQVEKLFAIERFRTLLQMTSTVSGEVRSGLSFYEIFRALFPSGSIVGAPKVRTMQIIGELEQRPRGIYTGAIGFISPEREAAFNVAIRTLTLRDGIATMGVGSGIVYDSNAEQEYEECRLKAAFLTRRPPDFQLIETMLWDGDCCLLASHLDRISASAQYFDFQFDREEVSASLHRYASNFAVGTSHKVRLLLDRSGGIQITSSPLENSRQRLSITLSQARVSCGDLYLRHKTTNRALYDRAYSEAVAGGFDDALFLNEHGEVAEGSIHNIFLEKEGRLLTPPLSAGVLPGVYRRYLLQTRPNATERTITLDDLRSAERVFFCNAIRGLRELGNIRRGDEIIFAKHPAAAAFSRDVGLLSRADS